MTSSTVVDTPFQKPGTEPARAPARGRRAARAGRFVSFLALGAVVLSFGLVAGNGDASEHTRSFSAIASASARTEARSLAAEAQVLAAASAGGPAAEFRAQAEGLRTQAALLTATGREPAAAATRDSSVDDLSHPQGTSASSATVQETELERRNIERYVQALWESAQTNLHSAWRADEGTARLLAATGTAQQIWAQRIAGLSGVPVPGGTGSLPGTAEAAGPDGSADTPSPRAADTARCADGRPTTTAAPEPGNGSSTSDAPAAARPDAEAALTSVINAELGTAYAYQVALAQVEPGAAVAGAWRGQAAVHERHGADAVSYLADLCLPPVAPVAAYRLDQDFLRDPARSLPALEDQFPAVYADLVALSGGDLRGWAITRLAAVSTDLYLTAESVPAAPGLDAVPDDLPWN